MPRLIWFFTRRTDHFVGFIMRWLKWQVGDTPQHYPGPNLQFDFLHLILDIPDYDILIIWPGYQHQTWKQQKTIQIVTIKFLNIQTPGNCYNYPKIWTMWLSHRVMSPKDADGMANSRSSLIWFYTVCPGLSVRKLRTIKVNYQRCR